MNLFKQKFLESSNIPASRFKDESTPSFVFGRSSEISRDEYRFKKFLDRLRNRFLIIFEDILRTQLLLKNIILDSDWEEIKNSIVWQFTEDNNFIQWKEGEVLNSQVETLASIDPFLGKYFTRKWVLKNVMKLSDDIIEKMLDEADKEAKSFPPQEVVNTPSGDENQGSEEEPPEEPEEPEEPSKEFFKTPQ